ncbi:MAG: hypothetical protein DCC65_13225 [Planctomycetota bacterium]|nr:MAG: hypothetical protein DCC65_13225 [Planctomycetota bacterium]
MKPDDKKSSAQANEFMREGQAARTSFLSDFVHLIKENRKWWMLPLVLMLVAFGALMILASTGAAPFIYTLF